MEEVPKAKPAQVVAVKEAPKPAPKPAAKKEEPKLAAKKAAPKKEIDPLDVRFVLIDEFLRAGPALVVFEVGVCRVDRLGSCFAGLVD